MKRKERAGLLFCFLLCAVFLYGCGKGKEPERGGYRIYYSDADGVQLVEEHCNSEEETVEGKIDEILKLLKKEPDTIDYKSVFVEGVEIEKWELQETKLSLYFNEQYSELNDVSELLIRASVVQSLVQISGVDYVCFFVGGDPLYDGSGREVGYMRAEDFVQNIGSSLHSYQTADLRLYFSNSKGDMLKAEEVSVRYNSNMSIEKLIVEQLIKGPSGTGGKAVIPAGTRLLGVSVRDNICYVNFDEGFLNVAEQVNPKVTVYALVNSIVDGGETAQVQILVNGETNITYQEIIDLSKPLSRNQDLIEEETR